MKNNYQLFFSIFLIITILSFSNHGYSKIINVPDEYTEIQAALNAAAEGDTVQVAPGTYNENIVWPDINGIKLIGSGEENCLIQGHESYKAVISIEKSQADDITINSKTLISGFTISKGRNGGIRCIHSSPYLSNLIVIDNTYGGINCSHSSPALYDINIIDNGADNGGGVYCSNSSPILTNVNISDNWANTKGGGIYCEYSSPTFFNVNISNNGTNYYGGGIYCLSSSTFSNLNIINNLADYGGGIYIDCCSPTFDNVKVLKNTSREDGGGVYLNGCCYNQQTFTFSNTILEQNLAKNYGGGLFAKESHIIFLNTTITQNMSENKGGGIYLSNDSNYCDYEIHFDKDNRSSIYSNQANYSLGIDIYAEKSAFQSQQVDLILDTFTVQNPNGLYITPINIFKSEIISSIKQQKKSNLFVSPSGDNSNPGTSLDFPLETIEEAVSIISVDQPNSYTIFLLPGIYSQNTNGENFPLYLFENLVIQGIESAAKTILDGNNKSRVLIIENADNIVIKEVTITNGNISEGDADGAGVYCLASSPSFLNVSITNNSITRDGSVTGAAICMIDSNPIISNVSIVNNLITNKYNSYGAGIYLKNCKSIISNIFIAQNIITNSKTGHGAGLYIESSNLTITNGSAERNIIENSNNASGSGFYISNSELTMNNFLISNNLIKTDSAFGGGLYLKNILNSNFSNINISDNSIIGNGLAKGAGMYFDESNPVFLDSHLIHNCAFDLDGNSAYGGGLCLNNSNPELYNISIKNNSASFGGGIFCYDNSTPNLENIIINQNIATNDGAGICFYTSEYSWTGNTQNPIFSEVTIQNNIAKYRGGGIAFLSKIKYPIFNVTDLCNIFLNQALIGSDIYSEENFNSVIPVYLETFTIDKPTDYYVYPTNKFTFSIEKGLKTCIAANLYVSTNGNDSNDGFSMDTPLKTIHYALSIIAATDNNSYTIFLNSGIFSPESNGEIFPLSIPPNVSIKGQGQNKTILNASGNSNVLILTEANNLSISDLLIKEGYSLNGGGIFCEDANDIRFSNVTLMNNSASEFGGGIFIKNCFNLSFFNILLSNNKAYYGGGIYLGQFSSNEPNIDFNQVFVTENAADFGGGVCMSDSALNIANLSITKNAAKYGGGIYVRENSGVTISGVSVSENIATLKGGGLYLQSSDFSFNKDHLCNIFNNKALTGNDLYTEDDDIVNIIVDTYTVQRPTEFHAMPVQSYSFTINEGLFSQVDSNLYVSASGSDSNKGDNQNLPLKTIQHALNVFIVDQENPYTIFVDSGVYSKETNGEIFPLPLFSNISIVGKGENETILDANGNSQVIIMDNVENVIIDNLSIRNAHGVNGGGIFCNNSKACFSNMKISNCVVLDNGAGIYGLNSNIQISNITIIDNNSGNKGGGVYFENSTFNIDIGKIENNESDYYGGGIYVKQSTAQFSNLIVNNNISMTDGGGLYFYDSNPVLSNTTITHNKAANNGGGIYFFNSTPAFDINNRCNIYLNDALTGKDLFSNISINVIVDTFSIGQPDNYYANPIQNFQFDVISGLKEQIRSNIFVSPEGDDSNSGINIDSPFKTIQQAMSAIASNTNQSYTIFLDSGTFSASTNNEQFPLVLNSPVTVKGTGKQQTILDAGKLSRLLIIENENNIAISGMTLKNGFSNNKGGAIYIENANPKISDISIENSSAEEGGGIFCYASGPDISDVIITKNTSNKGGGIMLYDSKPIISNVTINDNVSENSGGGLFCHGSFPNLSHVTIKDNVSNFYGGGISFINSVPIFDTIERCSIYSNQALIGNDLFSDKSIHVAIQIFSVLQPNGFHAYPLKEFTFDIIEGKLLQTESDLYVSPSGSNDNSGDNPDQPLKTIHFALSIISNSTNHRCIYLDSGVYNPLTNGEIFPLCLFSNISIIGNGMNDTILDADGKSSVFYIMSAKNIYLTDLMITNGASDRGAGLYSVDGDIQLNNIIISNNSAYLGGGGLYCQNSDLDFENIIIKNNIANKCGGGIFCDHSSTLFSDISIIKNSAEDSNGAGGGMYSYYSEHNLSKIIITDNSANQTGGGLYLYQSIPVFDDIHLCEISGNHAQINENIFSDTLFNYNFNTNVRWSIKDIIYELQILTKTKIPAERTVRSLSQHGLEHIIMMMKQK